MQASYLAFKPTDFVCDDAFLKHQLASTEESAFFWVQWLKEHPEKLKDWNEAVQLLEAVRLGLSSYARTHLSEEAQAQLLLRIQATNARYNVQSVPSTQVFQLSHARLLSFTAAACMVLLLGLGVWYYQQSTSFSSVYEQQVAVLPKATTEMVNQTNQLGHITLPDGSQVWLTPRSRLSYPPEFGRDNRTVYLLGEATFEVAKNPEKPFSVFANEIVTKVLGTRFNVKAYGQSTDVVVRVQHGQVSVYQNKFKEAPSAQQPLKGVLLLPNQQVVFSRHSAQFTKSIVEQPALLPSANSSSISFDFEETPVVDVLDRLKSAYGIEIIYNTEALIECQLTAQLTNESLFQKLDVITESIGATYEVVDGQVIITSKGCKVP